MLPLFTAWGKRVEKLSVRAAAAQFEVSRPTLSKWLKSGKISGERLPDEQGGGWLIDPAELIRAGVQSRGADLAKYAEQGPDKFTVFDKGLQGELATLREALAEAEKRVAVAEALAQERADRIEDLRRMLPAPDAKAQGKRWWPW
jgi:hypothetical protein